MPAEIIHWFLPNTTKAGAPVSGGHGVTWTVKHLTPWVRRTLNRPWNLLGHYHTWHWSRFIAIRWSLAPGFLSPRSVQLSSTQFQLQASLNYLVTDLAGANGSQPPARPKITSVKATILADSTCSNNLPVDLLIGNIVRMMVSYNGGTSKSSEINHFLIMNHPIPKYQLLKEYQLIKESIDANGSYDHTQTWLPLSGWFSH